MVEITGKEVAMERNEKASYLTLFGALLPVRAGRASVADALRAAPLAGGARRLADRLSAGPPQASSALPEEVPAAVQQLVDSAAEGWQPCKPPPSQVHPEFGSQHVSHPAAIEEIHVTAERLRCPLCGSERTLELDLCQQEHLHIRGHLEMHCGYCGASSLWEPATAQRKEACEVVI
jgi:hypothetical protein